MPDENKAIFSIVIGTIITLSSYLAVAGLVYLLAWSFEFPFTWKFAFGIWIILIILVIIFQGGEK